MVHLQGIDTKIKKAYLYRIEHSTAIGATATRPRSIEDPWHTPPESPYPREGAYRHLDGGPCGTSLSEHENPHPSNTGRYDGSRSFHEHRVRRREGWFTDLQAAKQEAAASGKPLLMHFSGSDWCGACMQVDKDILQQDAFKSYAKEKWVLVELDYPRDQSKQSKATIEQNRTLLKPYGIRGYPSVVLADSAGLPFATIIYRRDGPEAHVQRLDALLANQKRAMMDLRRRAGRRGSIKRSGSSPCWKR
jgi:thiol-disulfide isomerase/thioredoxin